MSQPTRPLNKPVTTTSNKLELENEDQRALVKINYILMAIAGIVIIIGFLLMSGGSTTTESFNPDIFSVRRVVVGPTIAFLGFIFMGVAIMYKTK